MKNEAKKERIYNKSQEKGCLFAKMSGFDTI